MNKSPHWYYEGRACKGEVNVHISITASLLSLIKLMKPKGYHHMDKIRPNSFGMQGLIDSCSIHGTKTGSNHWAAKCAKVSSEGKFLEKEGVFDWCLNPFSSLSNSYFFQKPLISLSLWFLSVGFSNHSTPLSQVSSLFYQTPLCLLPPFFDRRRGIFNHEGEATGNKKEGTKRDSEPSVPLRQRRRRLVGPLQVLHEGRKPNRKWEKAIGFSNFF